MRIAGRDVPTPLLVGGVAGVGVLVLGQRLTGQAPTPAGDAAAVADPAATGGGGGGGDLWGESELGQFPSLPPASSAAPDSAAYGWWDDEAPPAAPPPINAAPTVPATAPGTPAKPTGKRNAGVAGYVVVVPGLGYYSLTHWLPQPWVAKPSGSATGGGSRWVGAAVTGHLNGPAGAAISLRRLTYSSGAWSNIWIPAGALRLYT